MTRTPVADGGEVTVAPIEVIAETAQP